MACSGGQTQIINIWMIERGWLVRTSVPERIDETISKPECAPLWTMGKIKKKKKWKYDAQLKHS